ncbi:winged helix-turn-helix transcriptional regulator [Thioalkalivibrio paradoxus]|uniref:HxlR family transcriptional regulator n=1 Tax=Thioalkalivibrio paradoxus ARh 1 TaxID=713585 RepID=W0DLS7_9GAMM|nr:helix-turn-helix domain-containing protein [Thioalkalivibrio paradoxus]AHE98182.1 HxlR family transcriptional regulator [Thioalkalivibrio paradoxus ARh 1]
MTNRTGYGQFCPVAKASEILTTRWTPLILRELISGSSGFNEIHRGVPLMSRALLASRLRELVAHRIVLRDGSGAYRLTEAGAALGPIIIAMGLWGQRWVESAADGPDWDAGVLMWDMRRRIDTAVLPPGRTVVQFDYSDAPPELRRWWLLIEDDDVDLCQSDPGFEVDLYIATSVRVMGPVWIGQRPLAPAIEREEIRACGRYDLSRSLGRWLKLSVIAEQAERSARRRMGSVAP